MTIQSFDQQIETYVAAGFHSAAGLDEAEFRSRLESLRAPFEAAEPTEFSPVIVLKRDFVTSRQLISGIDRDDGKPDTVIGEEALARYGERAGVELPPGDAYVLSGVSKEAETRNVAPADVLEQFAAGDRSPLTIEEGLAVWRQFPDVIAVNDGFSLAGSTRGDKRVPAIWISKKRPKLGWCFFGVPHSWLATASCLERIGAVN